MDERRHTREITKQIDPTCPAYISNDRIETKKIKQVCVSSFYRNEWILRIKSSTFFLRRRFIFFCLSFHFIQTHFRLERKVVQLSTWQLSLSFASITNPIGMMTDDRRHMTHDHAIEYLLRRMSHGKTTNFLHHYFICSHHFQPNAFSLYSNRAHGTHNDDNSNERPNEICPMGANFTCQKLFPVHLSVSSILWTTRWAEERHVSTHCPKLKRTKQNRCSVRLLFGNHLSSRPSFDHFSTYK